MASYIFRKKQLWFFLSQILIISKTFLQLEFCYELNCVPTLPPHQIHILKP